MPARLKGYNDLPIELDTNGCWLWCGSLDWCGYGKWTRKPHRDRTAHLVLWERWHGPKPAGMELDHLCNVQRCVNDSHLALVPGRVNRWRRDRVNNHKGGRYRGKR